MPHFVDHDVPQQTIHSETLGWRVMYCHDSAEFLVCECGEISESALFYRLPIVEQRGQRESS